MKHYEDLREGQKVVFLHQVGGAGELSDAEKVGYIEDIDVPDRSFPIKIRIGSERSGDALRTYVEPEEILHIIE